MAAQSDHEKKHFEQLFSSAGGEERFSDLVPFLVPAVKRQGGGALRFQEENTV